MNATQSQINMVDDSEFYTKIFDISHEKKINDTNSWNSIVEEYDTKRKEFEDYLRSKSKIPPLPDELVEITTWGYMDKHVFPILIPALNSMMFKAKKYYAVRHNKRTRFNGLDHLAELMWNFNPKYPERYKNYTDIYDIPFVVEHLKENPRTIFPRSEIWTENYAAIKIQSFYRGYLVRREDDVQEMRKFWKELAGNPRCSVSLFDRGFPKHRDFSTRLQCFCYSNPADCINIDECQTKTPLSDSMATVSSADIIEDAKFVP